MAKVEHIRCSNMGCSNDSNGGAVATVEFDDDVKVPLCQPCLARSGLGIQAPPPVPIKSDPEMMDSIIGKPEGRRSFLPRRG